MDLLENDSPDAVRHPWEVRRSSFFVEILRAALAGRKELDVLDCGAGDGWFSSRLRSEIPSIRSVTCWDAHYDEVSIPRFSRHYPELSFTRTRPSRKFDLVLALDVIEHVEDDLAFVSELASSMADDGVMLVSVPAWQRLFSRHDRFLRHYRRYSPSSCDAVLARAGLRLVARGGVFHSLVFPRAVAVLGEKLAEVGGRPLAPATDVAWRHGKAVTSIVDGMLRADNAVSRAAAKLKLNVPGLSYWAVCAAQS